jgi:hypothetical protein
MSKGINVMTIYKHEWSVWDTAAAEFMLKLVNNGQTFAANAELAGEFADALIMEKRKRQWSSN